MARSSMSKIKYDIEDHGNGYMVIRRKPFNLQSWPKFEGVGLQEAMQALRDVIGKKAAKPYRFGIPNTYEGKSACWLGEGPSESWDGRLSSGGSPVPRSLGRAM